MKAKSVAALAAAIALAGPFSAAGQTLSVSLDPAQGSYFAGQRVSCILTLDLDGAELHDGGNLTLSGFPENGPALDFGRFAQIAPGPGGELRWAAPLALLAPTNMALAPRVSGTSRRETSRQGSFFKTYSLEPLDAAAEPLNVKVSPLPAEGRPAAFCGAVGPLLAEASLSPLECAPGDILTLRWKLLGPGAALASPVAWSPGPGFKAYPPRVEEREDGVFAVSQVVVPLAEDSAEAAPFSVAWFDPASGWKTGGAGPFAISLHERKPDEAESAEEAATAAAAPAPDGQLAASGDGDISGRLAAGEAGTAVKSVPARFAAGPRAKILFEVPAGTPLKVLETSGDWVRAQVPDGAAGWIPASAAR